METEENNQKYLRQIEELTQKVEELTIEKVALTEENESLREQLEAALKRIAELEEEVKMLKAEIERLKAYIEKLQQALGNNQKDTKSIEQEYYNALKELSQAQSRLQEAEAVIKQQEREIAMLYVELGDVKNALLNSVDALGEVESQKARVQKLLDNIQKAGWLHKKSPNTKLGIKLQKRYFVLRGGNLYYYKAEKDFTSRNRAHPKGVIPLDNISLTVYDVETSKKETGSSMGFEIRYRENKRVFVLIAANDEERTVWCEILNKTTDILKARNIHANRTSTHIAESIRQGLRTMGAFNRPDTRERNTGDSDNESDLNTSSGDSKGRERRGFKPWTVRGWQKPKNDENQSDRPEALEENENEHDHEPENEVQNYTPNS